MLATGTSVLQDIVRCDKLILASWYILHRTFFIGNKFKTFFVKLTFRKKSFNFVVIILATI